MQAIEEITLPDYEDVVFIHVPQLNNGSVAKTTIESETQAELHKTLLEVDKIIKEIYDRQPEKKP